MTDYFSYNGEDVVPTYMPGISSYGQEGSEGNTGDIGSSVYYTTYDLTDEDELKKCNEKIKNNLVLSDTDNSQLYNKEYMLGDIVIDALGNIFVIESGSDGLEILSTTSETESYTKEMFKDFTVKVVTSFLRNPEYPGYVENTEPVTLDKIRNYSSVGIDQLRKKIFGNWITFSITPLVKTEPYVYTFCLVLPSKEVLSITSDNPYAKMFVDNRYFSQVSLLNTYARIPEDDPYDTGKLMFGSDVRNKVGHADAYTFIQDSIYKFKFGTTIEYPFEEYYKEEAKYASMLISYLIHRTCSAYVEIKNKYTGKIYRYELRDSEDSSDTPVAFQQNTYITPYIEPSDWEIDIEDDYKESIPDFEIIEDPETQEKKVRKSLKNFIVVKSEQVSVEGEIGSVQYEYVQHFYFTDVNGTEYVEDPSLGRVLWNDPRLNSKYDLGPKADNDMAQQTPINYWHRFSNIDEYSNVLQLEIGDVDSICLNIDFSKWINSDKEFPATAVYVGYPNVHLWQEGDSSGNVILPNSINADKVDIDGNPTAFDGSRGYYYLYKILPPGYSTEEVNTDAGRSSIIFNLSQFKLNDKHNWIEIGLMVIEDKDKNINNFAHRSTIKSTKQDFNYYNEDGTPKDLRTLTFEELADRVPRQSTDYEEIAEFCLPFKFYTTRETDENDQEVSVEHFTGGEPEIMLFINNVIKHSSSESIESGEEEITVETQEESSKIDYATSGIHYEEEYYKITDIEV